MAKDIGKDKEVEVSRFVEEKVVTSEKTYGLKVDEWLDRTDSPQTLNLNKDIPFLALDIH